MNQTDPKDKLKRYPGTYVERSGTKALPLCSGLLLTRSWITWGVTDFFLKKKNGEIIEKFTIKNHGKYLSFWIALPKNLVVIGDNKGHLYLLENLDETKKKVSVKKHLFEGKGDASFPYKSLMFLPEKNLLLYAGRGGLGVWYLDPSKPSSMKFLYKYSNDTYTTLCPSVHEGHVIACKTMSNGDFQLFEIDFRNRKAPTQEKIAKVLQVSDGYDSNPEKLLSNKEGNLLVLAFTDGKVVVFDKR